MKINNAGIYIHIPFCVKKCPYCSFYSISNLSLKKDFINALKKEIDEIDKLSFTYDSIYIGGGTPSVLEVKDIVFILEAVYKNFKITKGSEITIEVNPGTVDLNKLRDYKNIGINRINIGVQSFQDNNLKLLGRIYKAIDASTTVKSANQAGFDNIGLDLMYAVLNQSIRSYIFDLEKAVSYAPHHLSCYMLTLEKGTLMEKEYKKNKFEKDDISGDMFEDTILYLEEFGYEQYEISNFANSLSKQSRHNKKYWNFTPYIGLGPSAHSFLPPKRYWNFSNLEKYIKNIKQGVSPIESQEILTLEQKQTEAVYLGFRQKKGININEFNKNFNLNFIEKYNDLITSLEKENLLNLKDEFLSLTSKGMRFLDSIASMFL